jgi:hypothetical protein
LPCKLSRAFRGRGPITRHFAPCNCWFLDGAAQRAAGLLTMISSGQESDRYPARCLTAPRPETGPAGGSAPAPRRAVPEGTARGTQGERVRKTSRPQDHLGRGRAPAQGAPAAQRPSKTRTRASAIPRPGRSGGGRLLADQRTHDPLIRARWLDEWVLRLPSVADEELQLLASAWESPARTGYPTLAVPSRYPEATTASRVSRPQIVGVLAVPGGSDHFPAFVRIHGHLRCTSRSVILKTSVAHNTVNR